MNIGRHHQVRHASPVTKSFMDSMAEWERTVVIAWITNQSKSIDDGLSGPMYHLFFDDTLLIRWQVVAGVAIIKRIEDHGYSHTRNSINV